MRVALLGLGSLGSAVAERLLAAGFPVVAWNRTPSRAEPLAGRGAEVVATPGAAAAGAEAVICCVSDESASRAVWLGPDGAATGLRPGTVAVELSSLPPAWLRELEPVVRERGARLVEAPVAGGPEQVRTASAHLLVGGLDPDLAARLRPVLDALGTWQHTGALGSASVLKALRNALVAVQLGAMAEVLAVAGGHEVDPAAVAEMLERGGGPASPVLRRAVANSLAGDHPATFSVALSRKDTRTALDLARTAGIATPALAAAADLLTRAVEDGHGAAGHTSLVDRLSGWGR